MSSTAELIGRRRLEELVAAALAAGRGADGTVVSVLMIGVEGYEPVVEALGFDAGDALIEAAAGRVGRSLPAAVALSRVASADLAVVLNGPGEVAADIVVSALAEPLVVGNRQRRTSASVGLAEGSGSVSAPALMRHARAALGIARRDGGGQWRRFDDAMRRAAKSRFIVEQELPRALRNRELRVHYQPLVSLPGRELAAAEALVRWQHPTLGLLSPAAFVPIAEQGPLIIALGDRVLADVVEQIGTWRRANLSPLRVSVNVSPRQLAAPGFTPRVLGLLREHEVTAAELALEITETALLRPDGAAAESVGRLAAAGIHFMLDDFGAGHASLAYLRRLPFGGIKIDRDFMGGVPGDPRSEVLLRTLLALGRALGLPLTAEGVEEEEQAAWLEAEGCDLAQGFLFGRPAPPHVLRRGELPAGGASSLTVF
jgi:predicted signal transduction protein with EAL and GGDEF domain